MAGLPLASWLLIVASVSVGLALEWAFLRARRHDRMVANDEKDRS